MVDMAHFAGLVASNLYPNPLNIADVVTTTTHKTLRGPRGGAILTNSDEIAKKINSAIFPGMQGGPLEHVIAAKAVCFKEALSDEFKKYSLQVIKNAKVLGETLKKRGLNLVTDGTDTHLILVDLTPKGITGKKLTEVLDSIHITVNKNAIPFDKQKPFVTSGVRIGTPAVTSRGFKEADCEKVAELITMIIEKKEEAFDFVRAEVKKLIEKYPLYQGVIE